MPEFTPPLPPRRREWSEHREWLASVVREMHFAAGSRDGVNDATVFVISGNLADLALNLPIRPTHGTPGRLVQASTLVAAQGQRELETDREAQNCFTGGEPSPPPPTRARDLLLVPRRRGD